MLCTCTNMFVRNGLCMHNWQFSYGKLKVREDFKMVFDKLIASISNHILYWQQIDSIVEQRNVANVSYTSIFYHLQWRSAQSCAELLGQEHMLDSEWSWDMNCRSLQPGSHVQFLSSFDHSVMHWLNSGLNQKFWLATTVSKCMQTPPS